ncbi:RecQ family ATP-dependent DNA helicase, partial [Methanosalsum natronophilum]
MQKTLQKYFGYSDFRYLQKEIISDVLKGHDTFALMPTGGGKSLCYQLPALIKDGVTVVVSPLISLMKDQVDGLKANGISAEYINSTLTYKQINEIKDKLVKKELKILYLAPERLLMSDIISHLKKTSIALFAIDEAHCISEWGHDFRPEYRKLSILKKHFKDVPIIALTATASPRVQKDIVTQLKLRDCKIYKGSFNRVNLSYYVNEKRDTYKQIRRFLIRYRNQSGIIYCQSRNAVEKIAKMLQSDGFRALPYHAGLSDNVRELNQNLFIQDDVDIIVATVAFGMGIDKPNVRFIIHYDLPKNLESYYQETGRGGRDGLPCDCILFFS